MYAIEYLIKIPSVVVLVVFSLLEFQQNMQNFASNKFSYTERRNCGLIYVCLFVFDATAPPVGHGLLIYEVSRSHTTTHHSRYDSSGRVISPSQRPLPDNTQHSQQTDINAAGGIRTHNLSSRAAADLRLRPRGHWDRPHVHIAKVIVSGYG